MHLQRMGVQVEILSGTDEQNLVGVEEHNGIAMHRMLRERHSPLRQLRSSLRLVKYIVKHHDKFDLLHSHGFIAPAGLASRLTGLPLVQKITNLYIDDPLTVRKRRAGYWFMYLYRSAWAIVASTKVLGDICQFSLAIRKKTIRIPNGVDAEQYRPGDIEEIQTLRRRLGIPQDRKVVLALGPLSMARGSDLLLKAMYRLRQRWDESPLLYIVEPQEPLMDMMPVPENSRFVQIMHRQIAEWDLQDIVRVEKAREPLAEYLKLADIYVHACRREGQTGTLLEAMSAELPVIAHLIPGLTDEVVQNGRFGFTVNCAETDMLAAALNVYLKNDNLRRRIGQQAREEILRYYDIRNIAAQYLDLYVSLLQRKHLKQR
jgi:glycosyltransferase involved in cell wall biosynthesis